MIEIQRRNDGEPLYTCGPLGFGGSVAPTAHHQVDGAADFLGLRLVSFHAVPGGEGRIV